MTDILSDRRPRSAPPPRGAATLCGAAKAISARAFCVAPRSLDAASRQSQRAALARQSAMYLAHVAFGLSYTAIGGAFGRDRTTVAHACLVVEERRDDPAFDAAMVSLENACRDPNRGGR